MTSLFSCACMQHDLVPRHKQTGNEAPRSDYSLAGFESAQGKYSSNASSFNKAFLINCSPPACRLAWLLKADAIQMIVNGNIVYPLYTLIQQGLFANIL